MRVMSFDPGATRMGWAVVDEGPSYINSGYDGREKLTTPFQNHKLELIDLWVENTYELLSEYEPDEVVAEIIPAVGGGNFAVAGQSYLANTAITVALTIARIHGIKVRQLGATTVKKAIGGGGKATKVGVRNGVLSLLPELESRRSEWIKSKISDETDAIAIALTYLGYTN